MKGSLSACQSAWRRVQRSLLAGVREMAVDFRTATSYDGRMVAPLLLLPAGMLRFAQCSDGWMLGDAWRLWLVEHG